MNFINRWLNFNSEKFNDSEFFFEKRREILFNRILILSVLITSALLLKDILIMRMPMSALLDFGMLLIILFSIWMIRTGHHGIAKSFFLLLMNFFTVFYASALPSDRGIFLYFFPLITLAFDIFDDDEFYLRSSFILLPVFLLILLVLTDFNLLGEFKLSTAKLGKYNLIINSVIASFMVTFFVEFMIRTNRQSERLLRQMAESLKKKSEDIQKVNQELDRFVYSTSHDLRAPLMSIQGLIKLALMDSDRSHDEGYFKMIKDRTSKLDDFIKEIIDYSRNARTELIYEPTSITQVTNEVIANLSFLENADRVKFEIIDNSGVVKLDKSRLKIVLNNLISNAIKYQNPLSQASWVKIETSEHENSVVIKIEDNGIGIPGELQGKIFEMFYRATEKSSGSGLGLYIVKEIIEKMKGSISVKSVLNESTSFQITIPLPA
jgi:hypothetical protein